MSGKQKDADQKSDDVAGAIGIVLGAGALLAGAIYGLRALFGQSEVQQQSARATGRANRTPQAKAKAILPGYLYHYTTPERAGSIRMSKVLRMSRAEKQDAFYGDGVYLTTLHPSNGKSRIVSNNYDVSQADFKRRYPGLSDKANFYFRFKTSDLPGVRSTCPDRDVWLYPDNIYLDYIDHVIGETDAPVELEFNKSTGALSRVWFS